MGEIEPTSINESKYPIIFVDHYSGQIVVYAIEKVLADMAPYGSVKRLRTDNGTGFTYSKWRSLLKLLLIESKLAKDLQNYAIRASVYVRNR